MMKERQCLCACVIDRSDDEREHERSSSDCRSRLFCLPSLRLRPIRYSSDLHTSIDVARQRWEIVHSSSFSPL